jgi:hypothetical protein
MRLFDLLRSHGARFPDKTQVIIADPIWAEIDKGEDHVWQAEDFPNIAPPFNSYFVEAQSAVDPSLWGGIHFQVLDNKKHWAKTTNPGQPLPPELRWVLAARGYGAMGLDFFIYPGSGFLHVGERGEWLDDSQNVATYVTDQFAAHVGDHHYWMEHGALPVSDFMNHIPFALTAICLLHCKNVVSEIEQPSRQQQRHYERKNGFPPTDYHVLKIRPRPERGDRSGREQAAVGLNRQHIARGHFKTFTEEAPLFGKWTGMYFWEAQVRGNPQRGKLDKAYQPDLTLPKE